MIKIIFHPTKSLFIFTLLAISFNSVAETRYITDQFEVTMRSGTSTSNSIISLLQSGQAVTLLDRNLRAIGHEGGGGRLRQRLDEALDADLEMLGELGHDRRRCRGRCSHGRTGCPGRPHRSSPGRPPPPMAAPVTPASAELPVQPAKTLVVPAVGSPHAEGRPLRAGPLDDHRSRPVF